MEIFYILVFLFIKHWYVDFVIQSMDEVNGKGIYFNLHGIKHSLKQGIGTALALNLCHVDPTLAAMLAVFDFVLHYHIDWAKMNLNKYFKLSYTDPRYWNLLGLDQLLHSLTYVYIAWSSTSLMIPHF